MAKLSRAINALPKILGIIGYLIIGFIFFTSGLVLMTVARSTPLHYHHPFLAIIECFFGMLLCIVGGMLTFYSMEIADGREDF